MRLRACALLLLLAAPAAAQIRPQPGPGDPRIQSVAYDPNQVVELQVAVGYQMTVELEPGEHVENVAVGDSSAWQVVANKSGDHLFVKAVEPGVTTNMVVLTDARRYAFDLLPASGAGASAYLVKFTYGTPTDTVAAPPPPDDAQPVMIRYDLGGNKLLRPSAIAEDGIHTYLTFPPDRPLPAVYTIDRLGHESLVNGAMRGGQYVIDAIAPELVFRLDHDEATARRVVVRPKAR